MGRLVDKNSIKSCEDIYNTAIEFSGVTKIYSIRERGYRTFRDSFSRSLNKFRQKLKMNSNNDLSTSYNNIIHALNNVSFSVDRGEALGIIGANGSGKTTILRLLANVTKPSSGEIKVSGKVAPLIQVGAGFHPDLTGRENVYLNGTIMGLSRREIDERYDDIVSFAELAGFMDTPVKRYSSGMYVRLGFAVVANIDPDIFLIDEILSVGDLRFQRKCLDTISEIRKSDKAIVFVSHNLSAVRPLCNRVIWLDKGEIRKEGDPGDVIDAYTAYMSSKSLFLNDLSYIEGKTRWGTGEARFTNVEVLNLKGEKETEFTAGTKVIVRLEYEAYEQIASPKFAVIVFNDKADKVFGSYYNKERMGPYFVEGCGILECVIDTISMKQGTYYVTVSFDVELGNLTFDAIGKAARFSILANNRTTKAQGGYNSYGAPGLVNMLHEWNQIK